MDFVKCQPNSTRRKRSLLTEPRALVACSLCRYRKKRCKPGPGRDCQRCHAGRKVCQYTTVPDDTLSRGSQSPAPQVATLSSSLEQVESHDTSLLQNPSQSGSQLDLYDSHSSGSPHAYHSGTSGTRSSPTYDLGIMIRSATDHCPFLRQHFSQAPPSHSSMLISNSYAQSSFSIEPVATYLANQHTADAIQHPLYDSSQFDDVAHSQNEFYASAFASAISSTEPLRYGTPALEAIVPNAAASIPQLQSPYGALSTHSTPTSSQDNIGNSYNQLCLFCPTGCECVSQIPEPHYH